MHSILTAFLAQTAPGASNPLMQLVPFVLIAAVFWFVLMRNARSSGGPGGVLNFGRSRARVYLKERVASAAA